MKRVGMVLALALVAGCAQGDKSASGDAGPAKGSTKVMEQPYFELKDGEGRVWVLGSVESLSKAKQGTVPEQHTTKVGYGPKGETVNFEAATPELEERLMAEYQINHPTAGKAPATQPAA